MSIGSKVNFYTTTTNAGVTINLRLNLVTSGCISSRRDSVGNQAVKLQKSFSNRRVSVSTLSLCNHYVEQNERIGAHLICVCHSQHATKQDREIFACRKRLTLGAVNNGRNSVLKRADLNCLFIGKIQINCRLGNFSRTAMISAGRPSISISQKPTTDMLPLEGDGKGAVKPKPLLPAPRKHCAMSSVAWPRSLATTLHPTPFGQILPWPWVMWSPPLLT